MVRCQVRGALVTASSTWLPLCYDSHSVLKQLDSHLFLFIPFFVLFFALFCSYLHSHVPPHHEVQTMRSSSLPLCSLSHCCVLNVPSLLMRSPIHAIFLFVCFLSHAIESIFSSSLFFQHYFLICVRVLDSFALFICFPPFSIKNHIKQYYQRCLLLCPLTNRKLIFPPLKCSGF